MVEVQELRARELEQEREKEVQTEPLRQEAEAFTTE